MSAIEYGIMDFRNIVTGAAILGSGGGGSYVDALKVLDELAGQGWSGCVQVREYDAATNCCVLAMMGSPDVADNLKVTDIEYAIANTMRTFENATGVPLGCVIPVEVGPVNSVVPLIAAALSGSNLWVVDGDGAGRAVPELPQTTYSGNGAYAVSPTALGNNVINTADSQSATLTSSNAESMEKLAGSIVGGFGSFSGIALWPSNANNGFALKGSYIPGTMSQAWALGEYLLNASVPPSTEDVVAKISELTKRSTEAVVTNYFITGLSQSTTSASLDMGIIRLDKTPVAGDSTETYSIYNLNENLIMFSSTDNKPLIIAPDSICYYSESTGLGLTNAIDDLAAFFDTETGRSTGKPVSIIKVEAVEKFREAPGVVASFSELLRKIGYAGALPYVG